MCVRRAMCATEVNIIGNKAENAIQHNMVLDNQCLSMLVKSGFEFGPPSSTEDNQEAFAKELFSHHPKLGEPGAERFAAQQLMNVRPNELGSKHSAGFRNPRRGPRGPLTDEEKDRRRKLNLCFYCGEPEHTRMDCKKLAASTRYRNVAGSEADSQKGW